MAKFTTTYPYRYHIPLVTTVMHKSYIKVFHPQRKKVIEFEV